MEPRDFLIGGGVLGVVGVGCCLFIAIPNFIEMQARAKRSEIPSYIEGMKTAELGYDANFDTFVHCPEPTPRPVAELDGELVPWNPPWCYENLGWSSDGDLRGTYWIEVSKDGMDFTVHGMADIDEDGIPCHYTATRSTNAVALTPPDVY
jgi:hypothetical protein